MGWARPRRGDGPSGASPQESMRSAIRLGGHGLCDQRCLQATARAAVRVSPRPIRSSPRGHAEDGREGLEPSACPAPHVGLGAPPGAANAFFPRSVFIDRFQ